MTLKNNSKFKKKLTSGLENYMRNMENFYQSTWKSEKCDPVIQSRDCISLKFAEELCVITRKNGSKFEKELTCRFKINTRNLSSFDPSIQKSQKFAL